MNPVRILIYVAVFDEIKTCRQKYASLDPYPDPQALINPDPIQLGIIRSSKKLFCFLNKKECFVFLLNSGQDIGFLTASELFADFAGAFYAHWQHERSSREEGALIFNKTFPTILKAMHAVTEDLALLTKIVTIQRNIQYLWRNTIINA